MSAQVEERIIGLRFDNKDFEKNVKGTLTTLDKLQYSIAGLKAGANNILLFATSLRSITFDPLVNGCNIGIGKLMALTAVLTGVSNVTSEIYNKFTSIFRSMSIGEQGNVGWSKYGDYTESMQTIIAATRTEGESDADAMERVNEQMERLLWFTDETSYNLTDMTSNVGKFTSQGIELEKAITAMQGIALWSANAGQDVQQASRAMYNLSQSLGVGAVRLQDWMSIENANMATKEFKELAIQAGIAGGTLKQVGKEVQTLEGDAVTIQNFRDTLSKNWLSTDVLMDVLTQYGSFAEEVRKYTEKNGVLASQAIEKLKEDGIADLYPLGAAAFEAGQAAITFKQAIESVQDAVSTQFLRIYQAIFGNYLEAKELWTDLADTLWDVFAGPISTIADVMERFHELGWMEKITAYLWQIWESLSGLFEKARDTILAVLKLDNEDTFIDRIVFAMGIITEKFHSFVNEFRKFIDGLLNRDDIWDNFSTFVSGLVAAFNIIKKLALDILHRFLDPASKYTGDFLAIISQIMAKMGEGFIFIEKYVKETDLFNSIFDNVEKVIAKVVESLKKIKDTIISTIEKFGKGYKTRGKGSYFPLEDNLVTFGDTATRVANIADIAGDTIVNAIDNVTSVIETATPWFIRFWQLVENIGSNIKWVVEKIKYYGGLIIGAVKEVFGMLEKTTDDMITEFSSGFSFSDLIDSSPVANFVKDIVNSLKTLGTATMDYYNQLYKTTGATTLYQKIMYTIADIILQSMNAFDPVIAKLNRWFNTHDLSDSLGKLFLIILGVIGIIKLIQLFFGNKKAEIEESNDRIVESDSMIISLLHLPSSIASLIKSIKGIVDPFKDYATMISRAFQQMFILGMAIAIIQAIAIMALATFGLSLLPWGKLLFTSMVVIPGFAGAIIGSILVLSKLITNFEKSEDGKGLSKKIATLGIYVAAIGAAFLMMSLAIAILVMLPWDTTNWEAVLIGIGTMFAALTGTAYLLIRTADASKNENQMTSAALAVLAIALGVFVVATAMVKISKIQEDKLIAAGVVTLAITGVLALMLILIGYMYTGGNTKDVYYAAGASALMLSASIMVIAFAIERISKIDQNDIIVAGAVVGGILTVIGLFMLEMTGLSKWLKDDKTSKFTMFIALVGIMALVVMAIASGLARITETGADSKEVIQNAVAIAIMIAVIGGVIFGMTMLIDKLDEGQVTTMLAVAGSLTTVIAAVSLLALGLAKLADNIDVGKLWGIVLALSVLILVIGAVVTAMTLIINKVATSSGQGALIVGILALVGAIITGIIFGIGLIVMGVAIILKSFVELAKLSDEATTNLRRVMAILAGAISEVLVEIFSGIEEGLSNLFGIKSRLGPTIVEFVFTLFDSILTKLTNSSILGKLKVFLTKLTHTIGAYIKDNHEIIRESLSLMIGDILLLLQEHGPVLIETVDEFLNTMLDNLTALLNTKGSMLIMSLSILVQMLYNLLVSVRNKLMDLVFGTITMFLLRLQLAALEYGLAAGNIVFTFIDGLLLAINTRAPILMEELALTLILLINSLADTIDEHADEIIEAVERLLDSMYNAFLGWVNSGVKIGGKLYNIGYNILRGVIKGILSGIPLLNYVINNLANTSIVKSFCDKLGIKSPSKVFEGFGINIDKGLGNGMTEGLGKLKGIVSDLASLIMGDFTSSFGDPKSIIAGFMDGIKEGFMGNITSQFNINDLMGDMTNLNPVITPGLDLSNIEGASDKISDMINPGDIDSISQSFTGKMTGMDSVSMKNGFDEMMKKLQNYTDVQNYNNTKPIDVNVILDGDAKKMLKVVKVENNKQYKATGVDQLAHA